VTQRCGTTLLPYPLFVRVYYPTIEEFYEVLVVSQLRRSPLVVSQPNTDRLARRRLVIPLVVERVDCEFRITGIVKGETTEYESGYDREFE